MARIGVKGRGWARVAWGLRCAAVCCALAAAGHLTIAPAGAQQPRALQGQSSTPPATVTPPPSAPVPTLAPMLRGVMPAVVSIATRKRAMGNPLFSDPFFRRFFGNGQGGSSRNAVAAGSGVIVDAGNGLVVTNSHVVEGSDEIEVTTQDGRRLPARLVGRDPATDIAVVRVEARGLVELPFGDSDRLEVGDYVVAIGNPFGLGQTATLGIVSALGRGGLSPEGYEDFIQTDAPINPGNSGGALVDLRGRLVGINTAILAPGGGNVGIGFAVPVTMVRAVLDQLVRYGEVRRGRIGVAVEDVTPEVAETLGLARPEGAVVADVERGSSAQRAGVRPGDVVVAVNGTPIRGGTQLRNRIGVVRAGETVELTLDRKGRAVTLRATVEP
ncbi:MAG TPA: trypsin-like peptidase domain-containing protein [Azospirillaceae bacterium]|nr:trypsin-like peptidase domain-containing protein [Azospirillaceae bacterium]